MADYTRTTIKLPQEVALSLDQQLTRQHKVKMVNKNNKRSFNGHFLGQPG